MAQTLLDDALADGAADERPVVVFLARKALLQNTRIFKQAEALAGEGYRVELIGLRTFGTPTDERHTGYRIRRVPLDPPPARLLRLLTRAPRPFDQADHPVRGVEADSAYHRARNILGPVLHPLRTRDWNRRAHALVTGSEARVDVVHANDLDTLALAARLARRYRCPVVYDMQELYTEIHALPASYRRLLRLRERALVKHAARIVAVNPAIAAEFERRYGRPVDAVVLNAAPQGSAGRVERTIRAVAEVPDSAQLLVYSGGLTPDRGIEETLLALRHLPDDVVLAFIGRGPLETVLRDLARREGLAERIRFCDYVPHESVPSFLATANVGVVPYRNVGLNHYLCSPSKLFHYIAAGLPIACSRFPFLEEVVTGGAIGETFAPDDPESIATAVVRILADPERYRERVLEAQSRYSWESERDRFLGVYRSLERADVTGRATPVATSAG